MLSNKRNKFKKLKHQETSRNYKLSLPMIYYTNSVNFHRKNGMFNNCPTKSIFFKINNCVRQNALVMEQVLDMYHPRPAAWNSPSLSPLSGPCLALAAAALPQLWVVTVGCTLFINLPWHTIKLDQRLARMNLHHPLHQNPCPYIWPMN